MTTRTVFIVDDNADFRVTAQWWLNSAGYEVVSFPGPAAALEGLRGHVNTGPACLLLDVRMPGMSGLEMHDQLVENGVSLPVIYMTGHADVPLAVQAMQKGAITFIEKPFADDALESALARAFARAESPPAPTADAPAGVDEAAAEWTQRRARLTAREREVLDWVIQDKLNKTISDLMGISIKTVELHRSRVMQKLGAKSITHLIKMVVSERVV